MPRGRTRRFSAPRTQPSGIRQPTRPTASPHLCGSRLARIADRRAHRAQDDRVPRSCEEVRARYPAEVTLALVFEDFFPHNDHRDDPNYKASRDEHSHACHQANCLMITQLHHSLDRARTAASVRDLTPSFSKM